MRAGIYIRVSTQGQASEGESLEMQQSRARELCQQHGWEMSEPYLDVMSGRKDKRPALKRFEADLKAGLFGVVICYKVDRLGRSRRKLHEILEYIQQHNVRLVSMTQQIDTSTATGRMMLAILVDFAVFEVEQLGERVSDTLLHIAKQGRPVSGAAPYGYRHERKRTEIGEGGEEVRVSGRLVIVPEEAEGVRFAFDAYQANESLAATAKALNLAGYRTRMGKPWDAGAVRLILTNPLYGGERALRRWPSKNGRSPTSSAMLRTMPDWIMVDADHEPIVPRKVAQDARRIYWESRDTDARSRTSGSPWSGLVVCEGCGYRMRRCLPGNGSPTFRCPSRVVGACTGRTISEAWLDIEVIGAVSRALDAAGAIQAAQEAPPTRQRVNPPSASPARQIGALLRKLERLEVRYEEEVIDSKTYVAERRRVQAELEALQKQSPAPRAPRMVLPSSLAAEWERARANPDAVPVLRRLLRRLVERVVSDQEGARVQLVEHADTNLPAEIRVAHWAPNTRSYLKRSWSAHHPACVDCGTTDRPHYATGHCKACYKRHQRNRARG